MAEFLICNKEHWMDSLTQKEIDGYTVNNEHFPDKYATRSQVGDIVEMHEDGWRDERTGHGKAEYACIKVPGLSFKNNRHLTKPRYKEVTTVSEKPKLDYEEDATVGIFKYPATIIKEYIVPTNIPELGMVDIHWVTLSGITEEIDRKFKYRFNMMAILLDANKIVTLTIPQYNTLMIEKT